MVAGSSLTVSTTAGIRLISRCVRIHCSSCRPYIPGNFRSSRISFQQFVIGFVRIKIGLGVEEGEMFTDDLIGPVALQALCTEIS